MGREQSGAVSSDGGWHRSPGGERAGEASDADVRAAVESVVEGPASGVRAEDAAAVDGAAATDDVFASERPGPDPDAAVRGVDAGARTERAAAPDDHPRTDRGTDRGADATGAEGPPAATPAAAAVGVGIGLLTVGVLLVVYRTMLAAGAGEFVAGLYSVGGLFVVVGFVAHALRRADEVAI